MRITAYGHRLISDLDTIDWPEKVKLMQRNWIGESHGASVHFTVETPSGDEDMEIYTTRPDTLFGTTFAVVSPEHHLLACVPDAWPQDTPESWTGGYATPKEAVTAYRRAAEAKTAKDRVDEAGEKTGLFTGLYAINPITGAKLPLFTADYVLMDYGTGAIMAVPGGDQRDYDFAVKYGLPVIYTVQPLPESGDDLSNYEGKAPFVSHDGIVINSSVDATRADGQPLSIDGLRVDDAIAKVNAWLEQAGVGKGTVSYRLRDWLFSRQRYWGEPFPIVYDEDGVAHLLPDEQLPINLPDVPDYSPKTFDPEDAESNPEAPLSRNEEWVKVTMDLGRGAERPTIVTRTRCRTGPAPAGTTCATSTRPTPSTWWRRTSTTTGWARTAATAVPAAWTCTSAASSTRCSTCCTRASGTRCCSTWAMWTRPSRSTSCSTRA